MTSSIRMICPNLKCRCVLSVPPQARGKTVRCRQCGMHIQVPNNQGGAPKPKSPSEAESAHG